MKHKCQVDDCNADRYCRGYCIKHYGRWKRNGDPTKGRIEDGLQMVVLLSLIKTDEQSCIEWPYGYTPAGYPRIKDGFVSRGAHAVMCRLAHGEKPFPDAHAAHGCNNKRCVNPNHLRWATPFENAQDRQLAGNTARGERAGSSKLTEQQVKEISCSTDGATKLAKKYGVDRSTIWRIRTGRYWKSATQRSLRAA